MNDAFQRIFARPVEAVGQAPGRVNLIGDHTDYAEGFCLPIPLTLKTDVALARAERFGVFSLANDEMCVFDPLGAARGDWTDYVAGPIRQLIDRSIDIPPVDILIRSSIPQGAGVSSSAALEVAVIRACLSLVGADMTDGDIARAAQMAENNYCGVQCGILDQMACAVGRPGEALLLDCRTNEGRSVAVPSHFHFMVVHCGQDRKLADGAYNARRRAVEHAARQLGVLTLRDASIEMVDQLNDSEQRQRARHVVSENARVLKAIDALERGDADGFGHLMYDSHRSLVDDFEVSVAALDRLMESSMAAGAYGARLTGAGFGGCIVALVAPDRAAAWWAKVLAENPKSWIVQG